MSSKTSDHGGKYVDSDEEMSGDDYSYDDYVDNNNNNNNVSEGKKTEKGRGLSVNISSSVEAPSFDVTESLFIKGDIAINKASVQKRHSEKMFVVDPSELVKGPIIGRGASSYVQKATHTPTGTDLALKVVNMYDKGTMTLDIYYLFNLIGLKIFAAINFRLLKNLKSYTLEYSF